MQVCVCAHMWAEVCSDCQRTCVCLYMIHTHTHTHTHTHMHAHNPPALHPLPAFHQSVFPPQQNCFVSQFTEKAFSKTEDIEHSLVLPLHLFTLVNKIVCSAVGRRSRDHQLQFRSPGQADLETKMSQLLESVLEPYGCGNHFALWVWHFSLLFFGAYCWYFLPVCLFYTTEHLEITFHSGCMCTWVCWK